MAEEPEKADAEGEGTTGRKSGSPIPFLIVGVLGVALGIAVPFMLPATADPDEKLDEMPTRKPTPTEIEESKAVYVAFNEGEPIAVNLNDGQLTRFLSIGFSLKVAEESEKALNDLLIKKGPPLMSWLIGHLSGKTLEDIRGKAGQNRVRREIRDEFNSILYPDGGDRIFDVTFSSFAVQ